MAHIYWMVDQSQTGVLKPGLDVLVLLSRHVSQLRVDWSGVESYQELAGQFSGCGSLSDLDRIVRRGKIS